MKDTIVLYPGLGRGHLLSMVELGKLIATNHPSFSITILILTPPLTTTTTECTATEQYMSSISAATPSITFHHLPPSPPFPSSTTLPPHMLTIELSRLCNHHFHQALHSISKTSNLKAIIMDFMNYQTTLNNNNIPTYFYYTSGASTLSVLLHFPSIHESTSISFKDTHIPLRIPGLPTIYTDDLPDLVHERESKSYNMFLDAAKILRGSVGIIVNTFEAIEGRVISALSERYTTFPKVFCIGPVIADPCCEKDETGCLSWLDSQTSQSVVLLSFGSMGRFSKAQLKEIAIGLEKSEQRFLWVVRAESDAGDDSEQSSLDELLPEGFLERTKEKGMVVRNWAPQAAILSHDSVGGFVTHCGWNSVLEAVWEGVPMVAWPLYAEQKLNRVILVNEMKVALGVNESKEDGFVSGTELGERVKELMNSDKGKEVRQRIFKMKIAAKEATQQGGSSSIALNMLAQLWNSC